MSRRTSVSSNQTTQVDNDEANTTDVEKQDASSKQPEPQSDDSSGPPGGASGSQYAPKTLKFWLIILCVFLSIFLVALDRTILTTAIPRITDEFNSLGDIGWYASAYMLTSATSQLIFGRIYKFYNMKMVFLTTVVIFEVGSAICGAAPNSDAFIAGRAIAGFASAGIFSGGMLIIIPLVPLHKRPMFQAMFGAVFGISSVLGPLVGGAFTSNVSWRWCFYINLPIGAVSLMFMALVWHPQKTTHEPASIKTHIKRLDPIGTFFFVPSIVCLLLAFQWGGAAYAWDDGRIIALFVLFGVLLLAFAVVQIKMPDTATLPARVVTQRSILCAALFTFFLASGMMMVVYYAPIWFQTAKLVDPIKSGIYSIPLVLSLVAASVISGFITQKIGYYVPAMYLCPCVFSVGLGLMSTFNVDTGSSHWIGYQFIAGFGLGFGMQNSGLVAQRILPSDIPTGIALMFFLQQLGGCIFTTVSQTILNNILISKLSGVPGLDSSNIINEGATSLATIVPPQYMAVVQGAYNYACTRIFLGAMGLALAALLSALGMEWKSIKKGRNGQDAPTGPGEAKGSPTDMQNQGQK